MKYFIKNFFRIEIFWLISTISVFSFEIVAKNFDEWMVSSKCVKAMFSCEILE